MSFFLFWNVHLMMRNTVKLDLLFYFRLHVKKSLQGNLMLITSL